MISFTGSNVIRAPLEEVFSLMADYRKWSSVFQGIRSVQPVREAAGETTFEVVDKADSRKYTVTQRAESPERIVRKVKKRSMRSKATYNLQPVAGGTLVTFTLDLSLSGLYKIFCPMAELYLADRITANFL